MKTKYLIDNQPISNLAKWCREREYLIGTFDKAIHRAKLKGAKDCTCKGHYIVRI